MVEHGLTPFDSGVTEPLRKAGNALRKADGEFTAAFAQLNADTHAGIITGETNRELLKPLDREKIDRRKEILEQLAAALEEL